MPLFCFHDHRKNDYTCEIQAIYEDKLLIFMLLLVLRFYAYIDR
jgi:hypothetical protein